MAAGAALARLGAGFDEILFSPKVRSRQTIEIAARGWGDAQHGERMREHPPLAGGFDAAQALDALDGTTAAAGADRARLLLVGHEPDFSQVVAELTGARIDLKKGGVAVVRLERRPGRGREDAAARAGLEGRPGRGREDAAARAGLEGTRGELVVLLRPRELALIAGLAVAVGVPAGGD